MTTTAIPDTIDFQNQCKKFVELHVYANVGVLVDYIIQKSIEDPDAPIQYEELQLLCDPSGWDAAQLNENLQEVFGSSWEDVTGESWYIGQRTDKLDDVILWVVKNQGEDQTKATPPQEWTAQELYDFVTEQAGPEKWEEICGEEFDQTVADEIEQWGRLPSLVREYERECDKVRDYIQENSEPREPLEWYAVSGWLGERLKEMNEIVVDCGGGLVIWGRETSGQLVMSDGEIEAITMKWLQMRGEL